MAEKSITMTSSVPHLIHYCWFGGNALSATAQRSLKSWEKYAPGFEIRRWDETNAPLKDCAFVQGAYEAGKWAFVSDYVRFWALYRFGGVYMDVGSELIRDISPLMEKAPFSAIELITLTVNTGLIICCPPGNQIVREVLDVYQRTPFIGTEDYLRSHTVNEIFTTVLERRGYQRRNTQQVIDGWTILSSDYFDPFYGFGGFHIKKNTYSVHHSSASWCDPVQQKKQEVQTRIIPLIGHRPGEIIGRIVGEISVYGVSQALPHLVAVAKDRTAR